VYDVAIIGGGIVGTSAAAFLAEAGASVVLLEMTALGAGASGRNSGAVQHPYDPLLAELHKSTLPLYGELATLDPDFHFPADPDGLLLVTTDEKAAHEGTADLLAANADLSPAFISAADMRALEPELAPGVAGCLLSTGYAVAPASATLAFARRAQQAQAEFRVGEGATLESARSLAGSVLVAGGPWSVHLVPSWEERPPIGRSWGVVATVDLARPPRRILEELSIDAHGSADPVAFSLMTAAGATSLGSTFVTEQPEVAEYATRLVERGQVFVPALRDAPVAGLRVCARPVSFDGRPLIGPVEGVDGLFVCVGHGPWGISTGPGSATLVVDAMLGRPVSIPAGLAASRLRQYVKVDGS